MTPRAFISAGVPGSVTLPTIALFDVKLFTVPPIAVTLPTILALLVNVPLMLVSAPVHRPSFSIAPPVLTALPFQVPEAKLVIAPVFEATLAL